MDKAATDRIEHQVRQAFPDDAIARVQVLQYGDDPEVEPGQAAVRVFFNWPGRAEGGTASPKTVHQFVTANSAALNGLADGLPPVIGWAEFRPEGEARPASAGGLSYRIADRGHPAVPHDEAPEERTPVMVRLGAVDLATVDALITAGIVTSRAEGLRWALSRLREHPAYALLQQQARLEPSEWPESFGGDGGGPGATGLASGKGGRAPWVQPRLVVSRGDRMLSAVARGRHAWPGPARGRAGPGCEAGEGTTQGGDRHE